MFEFRIGNCCVWYINNLIYDNIIWHPKYNIYANEITKILYVDIVLYLYVDIILDIGIHYYI